MSKDFLNEIIAYKKELNKAKEGYFVSLKDQLNKNKYSRYGIFKEQISAPGRINLIAEIKKASPSRGIIRDDFDISSLANIYSDSGASAISVLTEDKYFLGRAEYIRKVVEKVKTPVLAKDFFIDEGQIYEACLNGASAILLIVAILDDATIRQFIDVAGSLDLDCLVETHTMVEVDRAIHCGADIIGVNNRNLETFEVSLDNSKEIIPLISKDKIVVAESGIKTKEDVAMLKDIGANAVLIGETFMRDSDIASKINEIMNI